MWVYTTKEVRDYKITGAEDKVRWSGMGKADRVLNSISGRGKKVVPT